MPANSSGLHADAARSRHRGLLPGSGGTSAHDIALNTTIAIMSVIRLQIRPPRTVRTCTNGARVETTSAVPATAGAKKLNRAYKIPRFAEIPRFTDIPHFPESPP